MSSVSTQSLGTVAEAMSEGVISCSPATPLRTVARMLSTYRVHALVVYDEATAGAEGDPWGVVSDLDLVAATTEEIDDRTAGMTAGTPLVLVVPSDPLERAAQLMRENTTAHLVVVDPLSGRPIGVVSTLDIARAVAAQ